MNEVKTSIYIHPLGHHTQTVPELFGGISDQLIEAPSKAAPKNFRKLMQVGAYEINIIYKHLLIYYIYISY
jgi:hypothetical protein